MKKWTAQSLLRLQKKHVTDEAIGKVMGCTRQAVFQQRVRLGVSSVVARNDKRNLVIAGMYHRNVPVIAIAKKFNLSIPQTYRIISLTAVK